jgi:general stress protein 26
MSQTDLDSSIQGAKSPQPRNLEPSEAKKEALKLIMRSSICMLGTQGENSYIRIRALLNLKYRGLKKIWFSTNTSSQKVAQITRDNRVCLYYVDAAKFEGLSLNGTMRLLQDHASRQMLWSEGNEIYYPLGVDDPDYTVLEFTTIEANYYHGLRNLTFKV